MTITAIYRAGRVHRWSDNPDMADCGDTVEKHRGNVASIIEHLHHSPSVNLLRMALRHDNGEAYPGPGDASAMKKAAMPPDMQAWWEAQEKAAREAIHGPDLPLTPNERDWLKFADRLDSLWQVQQYTPHILTGDGWPKAIEWLKHMASKLGVRANVRDVLGGIGKERIQYEPTAKPLNQE